MVGIIIVNYNTWKETIDCVESIINNCKTKYRIYIIDNCSTNNSYEKLSNKLASLDDIQIILNSGNNGYSNALNLGFKKAIRDGCTLLIGSNNDIIYLPNSIERMKNILVANSNISVVSAQLIDNNGKRQVSVYNKHTFFKEIILLSPLKFLYSKRKSNDYRPETHEMTEIYAPNGGCFMIKSNIIKEINFMDENVFLYYEERILGKKIEKHGSKVVLLPEAKVIHDHSATVNSQSVFAFLESMKSDIYSSKEYYDYNLFQLSLLKTIYFLRYVAKTWVNVEYRKNVKKFFHYIK